jgi:hypothetical protein
MGFCLVQFPDLYFCLRARDFHEIPPLLHFSGVGGSLGLPIYNTFAQAELI